MIKTHLGNLGPHLSFIELVESLFTVLKSITLSQLKFYRQPYF